jgi:hypothetical protein
MIEMGAQWYHGTVNNPVFDLAGSLGLLDGAEPMLEEQGNMMARRTLAEGGTPVDPAVLGEASEAFDELVEEMEARADEIAVEFTSAGAFVRERHVPPPRRAGIAGVPTRCVPTRQSLPLPLTPARQVRCVG